MRPHKSNQGSISDKTNKRVIVLCRDEKKFVSKFQSLKENPSFQKGIENFRTKLSINLDKPILGEWTNDINKEFNKFLRKFKLGKEWGYLIHCYINDNSLENYADPYGIEITINKNQKFANFKIYQETILKDLKDAYKIIMKEFKDGKVRKTIEPKNYEIDYYIWGLRKKGKTYKQIEEEVYSNFGRSYGDFTISRIINKVENRIKEGF